MSYIPLKQHIIVERIEGTKETASGIILKSSEDPDKAKVIAVADDIDEVSVGDELLVNWNKLAKIDENIYRIHIDNVIAVY
jgi:co-chaperonin GroES (HSP10)